MREISKKVIVNTVLSGGSNVVQINDEVYALKDAGKVILGGWNRKKASTVKTASQIEIPATALIGVKNDGTAKSIANSTRYSVEVINAERTFQSKKYPRMVYSYTTPSENSTMAMIVAALVSKINAHTGNGCKAYAAKKIVITGTGAIVPPKGRVVYQGSAGSETWTGIVLHTYSTGAWAAASSVLIVAETSGTFQSGTAINYAGAAITTTAAATVTENIGLGIVDNGDYYTGEIKVGPNSFLALNGFASADGVSYNQSGPGQLAIGIGDIMLKNVAIFSRDKRDLFQGKYEDVFDEGMPVAGKTYDIVLLTIQNETPDQNQQVPYKPTHYEIYVENSNSTNVTNLVAALKS